MRTSGFSSSPFDFVSLLAVAPIKYVPCGTMMAAPPSAMASVIAAWMAARASVAPVLSAL